MAKRSIEAVPDSGIETKKIKMGPFREKGELQDEVTLLFDDEKELYVSQSFLKMLSPVFKAMLESEFKEKSTGVIRLVDKTYGDFLNLLEFLHPGLDKPITEATVFNVLPLAHEYQVASATAACKRELSLMISVLAHRHKSSIDNGNTISGCGPDISTCLKVLGIADKYSCNELMSQTLTFMQHFESKYYFKNSSNDANKLFLALSDKVKLILVITRLKKSDS